MPALKKKTNNICPCVKNTLTKTSEKEFLLNWKEILNFYIYMYFLFCRSTGVFVFLYSLFYYFKRSNMSGFLQTVEFFGYTILTCYVFFLMLGTVSFFASLKFIRYIYVNIKMDWVSSPSAKNFKSGLQTLMTFCVHISSCGTMIFKVTSCSCFKVTRLVYLEE